MKDDRIEAMRKVARAHSGKERQKMVDAILVEFPAATLDEIRQALQPWDAHARRR